MGHIQSTQGECGRLVVGVGKRMSNNRMLSEIIIPPAHIMQHIGREKQRQ